VSEVEATASGGSGDTLVPFMLGAGLVRGRLVRLGPALDTVLSGHDYPEIVAERLAETMTIAAALSGALKYDGVFTLQIQGDGPISLVVADVTSSGNMRAYARFDAERLAARAGSQVAQCFGKGSLAFTVDQGPGTDRYQGIVDLAGETLADSARAYFERSEQLATDIKLATRPPGGGAGWRSGAAMIQRMPTGPNSPILTADEANEVWNRSTILMGTLRPEELLDRRVEPRRLLHRLFHADGYTASAPKALRARCRCSAERVRGTLRTFPRAEIESLKDDNGEVVVTCEFCKTSYHYSATDLDELYAAVPDAP
jgi:molecular chaperone Hsp33